MRQPMPMKTMALLLATALLAGAGCGGEPAVDFEVGPESEQVDGKADANSALFAGSPTEFDPGPPAAWAELFAKVPNYRLISRQLGAEWLKPGPDGKTRLATINEQRVAQMLTPIPEYTLTKDKFRFEMGPLFYRGRLDGSARVLVVGQDAATDEALVHRAFVGATGQKVQAFLNSVGIPKSYICVNTFIYSIFEQFDEFTEEVAMKTAIKDFRNQLLDKIMKENKIELIISFGSAAHATVRSFRDEKLGGKLPANVLWVPMLHPGMAGIGLKNEDATMVQKVAESFAQGWKRVWSKKKSTRGWLVSDAGGRKTQATKYYYYNNDIPYRDLPYGASRELGRGGTKSERGQSGMQVQLRSAAGVRYEAPTTPFPTTVSKAKAGLDALGPGEITWEPARVGATRHDPGPQPAWVELLARTPGAEVIETESGVALATDFTQPVWYRGRINGAPRVLVLAQDLGVDQLIAGRALVGELGQKLQHFLNNAGVGLDYLALDVVPYPLTNVAPESVPALAASPTLAKFRDELLNKVLAEKPITVVLTVGPVADAAFERVSAGYKGKLIRLTDPSATTAVQSWNLGISALKEAGFTGAATVYTKTSLAAARKQIPRDDLRWGLPLWFGSSGDLSQHTHEAWVFWNAPRWVNTEVPEPPVPVASTTTPPPASAQP